MILFWLILLFVTVPLVELALLIWVGGRIGTLTTIAIVVLTGILGATLARLEGLATWRRFQLRLASGELPHEDLIDGLLILIAGAVLLTPGLLTDVAGFLLLVPPARRAIRHTLFERLKRRVTISTLGFPPAAGRSPPRQKPGPSDDIVDAEYRVEE